MLPNKQSSSLGHVLPSGLRAGLFPPHPQGPGRTPERSTPAAAPSFPQHRPPGLRSGCGCPFKQQNCCNRRPGTGPFRRVEPIFVAATNGSAAFSAGDPNFAARSLALKKKEEKKSGGERRGCCTARRERVGAIGPLPVRAHRLSVEPAGAPETPPRSQPDPGRRGPPGRGAVPGRGRPRGGAAPGAAAAAISTAGRSPSRDLPALGRGPGGEGPALPRRRPLAASPGLRSMPRAG